MWKFVVLVCVSSLAISCNTSSSGKDFVVTGTVENNTAATIYLEEVPASMMQPKLVDSAKLDKDGNFSLHAAPRESVVYNLRLDQNTYPVASIINDAPKITLHIKLNKENNQFAESYEVEGSEASKQMRDYMITFNKDQQKIFYNSIYIDSLQRAGANDSMIFPVISEQQSLADKMKEYSLEAINKANDPALVLFELGFYQSIANGAGFGLEPLSNEKVTEIIKNTSQKFPSHEGLSSVNKSLMQQIEKMTPESWVGKEAPDFSLPDVNGNEVKLSSFRGKYVLVDFWASWCLPCRQENPNVVNAYQQFKDKNFTVLGVSLDRPGQKDDWIKAINEDHLAWTQVSDLKFWDSSVVPLYGFEGIPYNILVDPTGKVIAEELRGEELTSTLKKIL